MILRSIVLRTLAMFVPVLVSSAQPTSGDQAAVSAVLDELHAAASAADFDRYFDLFAPNSVFLGTDATERWTVDEFKAYARARFDQGRGWTYTTSERHVFVAEDGRTAWFDEMLENANLGTCRGSGALVKLGDSWKVAQYNLMIPIPNELARDVVAQIRALRPDSER